MITFNKKTTRKVFFFFILFNFNPFEFCWTKDIWYHHLSKHKHTNDNNIQMKHVEKKTQENMMMFYKFKRWKLKGFLLSLSYLKWKKKTRVRVRRSFSVQINKWHEHENINLIYILFISPKNCIWFFVTSGNVCNKTHFQTKTFNSKCFPFCYKPKVAT